MENFGPERVVAVYTEIARQTFLRARALPDTEVVICYWRDTQHPDLRWLDSDDPGFLVPREASFIESFVKSMRWCFEAGAKRVVHLSALVPDLPEKTLAQVFETLTQQDLVLGPDPSGEWYLLGTNDIRPDMFKDYPWDGENKCSMLTKRAKNIGQTMHLLPEFRMVTDVKSLQDWVNATGTVLKLNNAPIDIMKDFPAPRATAEAAAPAPAEQTAAKPETKE